MRERLNFVSAKPLERHRRFAGAKPLRGVAEVIKDWDAHDQVALPLAGAQPVKGLKVGRPVSTGEPLARNHNPLRGDVHASINGLIEAINELEIIIRRDDEAVGEPPRPIDMTGLSAVELAARLKELGLDPPQLLPGDPLIVSTLEAEPGLAFSPGLFSEHRETILAGAEALARLYPGRGITWAVRRAEDAPAEAETVIVKGGFPYSLPALIKKKITGLNDPHGQGVFGGRELHLLGRVFRTGLPLTRMVLTLAGANYFIPVGARVIDLLTFANLLPSQGDIVIQGGLILGHSLARMERGLDKSAAAIHLARRAEFDGPYQNCRACGQCARACPVGLPVDLAAGRQPEEWLSAPPASILDGCLQCGACALACPARRPLMSMVRLLPQAAPPSHRF